MAFDGSPEPSRRSRLHGFTFASAGWGRRRLLRCVRLPEEEDEELREVRTRVMAHYRVAAENIQRETARVVRRPVAAEVDVRAAGEDEEGKAGARPWNLRTRRAVCGVPAEGGGAAAGEVREPVAAKRREFCLTLRPEEVEADLRAMAAERCLGRKRKRPSQKYKKMLERIFPGAWLTEITVDTYKITE